MSVFRNSIIKCIKTMNILTVCFLRCQKGELRSLNCKKQLKFFFHIFIT